MQVYLNNINGLSNAIISMFMSKRTWTPELNADIIRVCSKFYDEMGLPKTNIVPRKDNLEDQNKLNKWLASLFKFGQRHFTMLRFIDFSFTVEGIHRGAQDDFDSHAKRLDNRIIRSSTRLATFSDGEMSDYYKGKIYTTDDICKMQNIDLPDKVDINGETFIKTTNGYIREDLSNNKDIKRGLYMLSIPSNFIFMCNLTEFAHILKERDINSNANPELIYMIELVLNDLQKVFPQLTREYLYGIPN